MTTYYLRDEDNNSVVDAEVFKNDLRVVVPLGSFCDKLLDLSIAKRAPFITEMTGIQELRGEWFERALPFGAENINDFVTRRLKDVGNRWNLVLVID